MPPVFVTRVFKRHSHCVCCVSSSVRPPQVTSPLPPLTLEQAGAFCVCLSAAWGTHVGAAAWWATASQVSKTAPTGEFSE